MKFYGYTNNSEQSPMELSEVTLSADPEVLRQLSEFIANCANQIESSGCKWEHEHFKCGQSSISSLPSFIVHNAN